MADIITPYQLSLLRYIWQRDGITLNFSTKGAVAKMVRGLASRGFLSRRPRGRNTERVELTTYGHTTLADLDNPLGVTDYSKALDKRKRNA